MGLFNRLFGSNTETLRAPVSGKLIPLNTVPDTALSQGQLGNGIAIEPTDDKVFAPCDAVVDTVFETGHAVLLNGMNGAEILIHIGLDTTYLKGRHYTIHCKVGDPVKTGDLLVEFDNNAIRAEGYNTLTTMLVCNSNNYATFRIKSAKTVASGDSVIELSK